MVLIKLTRKKSPIRFKQASTKYNSKMVFSTSPNAEETWDDKFCSSYKADEAKNARP